METCRGIFLSIRASSGIKKVFFIGWCVFSFQLRIISKGMLLERVLKIPISKKNSIEVKNMNKKTEIIKKVLEDNVSEEKLNCVLAALTEDESLKNSLHDPFMTEKEACDYCGNIVRSTLWRWRKIGLKSYLVAGRRMFRASDLEAFIKENNMEVCYE